MEDKEKLKEAIKTVKNFCRNQERCTICPFFDTNYKICRLQSMIPQDWYFPNFSNFY